MASSAQQGSTKHDSAMQNKTKQYKTNQHLSADTKDKKGNKEMKEKNIELQPLNIKTMHITIEGDSDLILNKMNDAAKKQLLDKQASKAKSTAKVSDNEMVMTAMHWLNGTPTDFSDDGFVNALAAGNCPCISGFALKKSFGDAVVRNELDKYKTKFDASVNLIGKNNLFPISFANHYVDEKLIAARQGSPVRSLQNRFDGWSTTITVQFMDKVYSAEQIVNIINLAGFGLGIGSGRSSGYGRYHVTGVIVEESAV